jgi:sarcosine oxidase subunit gamma
MLDRAITSTAVTESSLPAVRVSSARWLMAVRLKSWLPEHRRGNEAITVAGQSLPRRVGATVASAMQVLCVAPGEWLVLTHQLSTELKAQLQPALRQQGIAFTDWTDAFATFLVEGRLARTLLTKGCGLDLDAQAFPQGRCARTRFAQIPVILQCLDEARFELAVARSCSDYLQEWLSDATTEWQHGTSP